MHKNTPQKHASLKWSTISHIMQTLFHAKNVKAKHSDISIPGFWSKSMWGASP